MAGRKSTVERLPIPFAHDLSNTKLGKVYKFMMEHNCGFIIRWRGEEFGVTIEDWENTVNRLYGLQFRHKLYIRKGGI